MYFTENLKTAWQVIGRNKIRSFLTMLGIIIGVMSVIIIISVGAGAQSLILNQIKSMGSDLVGILPGKSDEKGPPASAMGILITSLKSKDIEDLVGGYAHIVAGTGYVRGIDTVEWEDSKTDTNFVGVSSGYLSVEDVKIASGRFFTQSEEKSNSAVAVLGSTVAEELFKGGIDPIGQKIKIKKSSFNIIGVMQKRGVSGFQNQDNQIFVPLTSAQKMLLGINYINFARLKIDHADNVDSSMEYIKYRLRELHGISNSQDDDFSVRSMAQGIEVFTKVTNALRIFLASVASIALIVGGIGIMNIMLAAVQERTREIGLRKAVGAKSSRILSQFLVETVTITLLGGVIGIVLGSLISAVVAKVAQSMGYNWDLTISIFSIVLACVVSISVGLVFGILPARRASRLDPIEALRYE